MAEEETQAEEKKEEKTYEYAVCLSYARADDTSEEQGAGYVSRVVKALKRQIDGKIFYDRDEIKRTIGRDLNEELQSIYENNSRHAVLFVSKAYLHKDQQYTRLERRSAISRAGRDDTYLLLGRFDKSVMRGVVGSTCYADLNQMSPEKFADIIAGQVKNPRPVVELEVPNSAIDWPKVKNLAIGLAIGLAALAVLLFSTGPAVKAFHRWWSPSDTSVTFTSATENVIHLRLTNTGPNESTLAGFELQFNDLPIQNATLVQTKAYADKGSVPPDGYVDLGLKLSDLELLPKDTPEKPEPFLKSKMIPSLDLGKTVTLKVTVCESNDSPGKCTERSEAIPADKLKAFIEKWVPDHVG